MLNLFLPFESYSRSTRVELATLISSLESYDIVIRVNLSGQSWKEDFIYI